MLTSVRENFQNTASYVAETASRVVNTEVSINKDFINPAVDYVFNQPHSIANVAYSSRHAFIQGVDLVVRAANWSRLANVCFATLCLGSVIRQGLIASGGQIWKDMKAGQKAKDADGNKLTRAFKDFKTARYDNWDFQKPDVSTALGAVWAKGRGNFAWGNLPLLSGIATVVSAPVAIALQFTNVPEDYKALALVAVAVSYFADRIVAGHGKIPMSHPKATTAALITAVALQFTRLSEGYKAAALGVVALSYFVDRVVAGYNWVKDSKVRAAAGVEAKAAKLDELLDAFNIKGDDRANVTGAILAAAATTRAEDLRKEQVQAINKLLGRKKDTPIVPNDIEKVLEVVEGINLLLGREEGAKMLADFERAVNARCEFVNGLVKEVVTNCMDRCAAAIAFAKDSEKKDGAELQAIVEDQRDKANQHFHEKGLVDRVQLNKQNDGLELVRVKA
jgi:hypothetical protein